MSIFSGYLLLVSTYTLYETRCLWKLDLASEIVIAVALFSILLALIYIIRQRRELTVLKQTIRELESKEQFLRTTLDNLTDGIIACDRDGTIEIFNPASQTIFGELNPISAKQLAKYHYLYDADSKILAHHEFPLLKALDGESIKNTKFVAIPKSGKQSFLLANASPLVNINGDKIGAVVTFHATDNLSTNDVASLQSKEPQLASLVSNSGEIAERTSDRLTSNLSQCSTSVRKVLANSPSSKLASYVEIDPASRHLTVMLVDDCFADRNLYRRYLQTNSDYLYTFIEAETGEEAHELYQKRQLDLVLLDYLLPDIDGLEWLTQWQRQGYEERPPVIILTGQGSEIIATKFIELGATGYLSKNRLTSDILRLEVKRVLTENQLIKRDIQRRKQMEQNIRAALEHEKKLNELKSRFVTMTSHEFRTPLSSILSSSELLEHYGYKWSEEKKLGHLHRIQSSVKHMTGLLEDVLLLGKADAGKLKLNPTEFDLYQFCKEAIEEMELISKTHHVIFSCDNESAVNQNSKVCLDAKLLRHILNNLLSNAIKYSPNQDKVYFNLKCEPDRAIFRVRDLGIGIPQEEQERLFDSFHRASNVNSIPGTGLGLPIVKRAVNLHGGTIAMDSKVGVGTIFTVKLPYLKLE